MTAKYNAACCLMHNKDEAVYNDFLEDMVSEMAECVKIAREAGVADDKIMLDPGVGFGKTYEMNLAAINHVDVLHRLGFPILLGTSRKSVIGKYLKSSIRSKSRRHTCHNCNRCDEKLCLCTCS